MSPIVREYYRVPRGDRETYIRPAPADLAALVERNRRLIGSWTFEVAGRPLGEFRAAARAETLALARRGAGRWGFALEREWSEPAPIIATGHQPQPFHPGVWIKNFLAGSLARAVGGVAVNLGVDNDEAHGMALRFPVGCGQGGMPRPSLPGHVVGTGSGMPTRPCHPGEVRVAQVALAGSAGGVAFEEQPAAALRSEAAGEVLAALPPGPMADAFRRWWQHLLGAAAEAGSLGEAIAAARRRLEEELGLRNLELPVSHLADGAAFRLFVSEMLARHEELFAAYNDALAEYRRAYRERSRAQPVPDLARQGPRLEMPLWVWRAGGNRRRLWVEPTGAGGLALYADREPMGVLDGAAAGVRRASGGSAPWVELLAALRRAGWKIRPRALAMTLFVRLAVGDVFIHGLGGALYDKITDGLFERLWGVRPPELILASATVHLPLEAYPATPRDLERARRAVRDWRYNPDRMLSEARRERPEAAALVAEKRRLLAAREPTREARLPDGQARLPDGQARRRAYLRVHEINAGLAALEPDGPPAARRDLDRVERELRANAILRDREAACWFHPPEDLAAFYRETLRSLA